MDGHYLLVKFHKTYFEELKEKLAAQALQPGYQILISDSATQAVVKSYSLTFVKAPDLSVEMKYPVKISAEQALKENLTVTVTNNGAAAADNIQVQMVLSSDEKVPLAPAEASETFKDNMQLENGSATISTLPPGQRTTVEFTQPIIFPKNLPPGKYYLAAVADPQNTIKEINKEDNIFKGFIILTVPEPKRITLNLQTSELVFNPADYGLKISSHGILLTDGKDWRKCRMKAYLYQFKHVGWENIHWEINTIDKGVWEITGAQFCKTGGTDRELDIKLTVRGGSKATLPIEIRLQLPSSKIEYDITTGRLSAMTYGKQIVYIPFWKVCRVGPGLYQFNYAGWTNYFLQVNTQEKAVYKVTDGNFCRAGGTLEPTDIPVVIEE